MRIRTILDDSGLNRLLLSLATKYFRIKRETVLKDGENRRGKSSQLVGRGCNKFGEIGCELDVHGTYTHMDGTCVHASMSSKRFLFNTVICRQLYCCIFRSFCPTSTINYSRDLELLLKKQNDLIFVPMLALFFSGDYYKRGRPF